MSQLQRMGGAAALINAFAYLMGIIALEGGSA